jgi:hypothetical protein
MKKVPERQELQDSYAGETQEELIRRWNTTEDLEERNALLKTLETRGLFPELWKAMDSWEREGGLYPSVEDPQFTQKLLKKQEFLDSKQETIKEQYEAGDNPCDPYREFELTPVQRFVGRFLSPETPYQSALLYHGVGVGKTCAAITIAESYLRAFPRKSVIIVAPRTIQPGFRRTIFDDEALKIPENEDEPNIAKGCTGNSYLKRTGSEYEKEKAIVQRRVTRMINTRYTIVGYIQFYRMIEDILSKIPAQYRGDIARESAAIRKEFDGRLVIIDEAHNLRDSPGQSSDDSVDDFVGADMTESDAGKKLTPHLLKVLRAAQGMKLVLMSGTPMYNSYREIIFLLNLLLTNDKRITLSEKDVFTPLGKFTEGGAALMGTVASAYVSFMRGENPLSFPVRLPPLYNETLPALTSWPPRGLNANLIWEKNPERQATDEARLLRFPFVPVRFEGASLEAYKKISEKAVTERGIGIASIDEMVQSGNWLFPSEESETGRQIRDIGFEACFQESSVEDGSLSQFRKTKDATWLLTENIAAASTKAALVLGRIKTAKGPVFLYSRFIKSGVLPFAIALEANGYTPWGRDRPLFVDGIQDGLGRQCAFCERRESGHTGASHGKFVPAHYILITGRASISPNNALAIQAARSIANQDGQQVKVILGSQVASEGIDFRFVREIYMFDSWFHLNKMEQVLGRGIRTCSHSLLKNDKFGRSRKNCTIHLLLNTFGEGEDMETADMYMYRSALNKAIQVGRVTRVLKQYALDCNLNRDAIVIHGETGLPVQQHTDSQGKERKDVNVNDTPYTNLCDWLDTCEYSCKIPLDLSGEKPDIITYDEYAARVHESQLKRMIREIFEKSEQPIFRIEQLQEGLQVPVDTLKILLGEVIQNKSFRMQVRGVDGYILYRNGLYLFQPFRLSDTRIPLALRVAHVPVKKESYEFSKIHMEAPVTVESDTYWLAACGWAEQIRTASVEATIPDMLTNAIQGRFTGDEQQREMERIRMVRWLYEEMKETNPSYCKALADAFLEFLWDETMSSSEQQRILASGDESAKQVAREQIVKKDTTEAFRYVDPITGVIKYLCKGGPCYASVTQFFESDTSDPLRGLQANTSTTGRIYGFMVPKAKEGHLIFKTSDRVVKPGKAPEKGSECAIISTISHHIVLLKELGKVLEECGYPRFLLRDEVLDEKERIQIMKKEAKAAGRIYKAERDPLRSFENTIRACTLKDLILRWLDKMEGRIMEGRKKGLRYFYRPIAAAKSGHKGTIKE